MIGRLSCAAILSAAVGCGGGAFDPYEAYERPLTPDGEKSETVAPARLQLAVSGDPKTLDATQARLKALVEEQGGSLAVVDPAELHGQLSYALGRSGPFAGRDSVRLSRYEVRFKGRIESTLAPMRAVWVAGKKTTFEVGKRGGEARLVDEGMKTYRLVLAPRREVSPLVIDAPPQRMGQGWTLTGAPPVKLYELRHKRWVRIPLSLPKVRVTPAPPRRVRVFLLKGLTAGVDALLAGLLRENSRTEDGVLSLSLDGTHLWLNAETREAPAEAD